MSIDAQSEGRSRTPAGGRLPFVLIAGAAFALYWASSFILDARGAVTHFGADSHHYEMLADGTIFDRTARFHPVTVGMALAWMKGLGALGAWMEPNHLLKAMFAAVGAAGVWAAMAAFATAAPGSLAPLWAVIYGTSFAVWYFASIEESKIVTATLCAFYIASYLRLRERWTRGGAVALSAILLAACLNEIASGLLVVIPIIDTLMRRGWDRRELSWISAHVLVGPFALLVLEGIVNGPLVAADPDPEQASHFSLLFSSIGQDDHGAAEIYAFVVNWLFFSIAAPSIDASYDAPAWGNFNGYFEPALANYLSSPVSSALVAVAVTLVVASLLPRYRREWPLDARGMLAALATYVLLRGVFFFIFNPDEALLFTPAIALAYLLVIAIPVGLAAFPGKRTLVAALAGLLFVSNGAFIIGP